MKHPKEPIVSKYLKRQITRRQVVKLGGVAALGLVFHKPLISSLTPTPVFADYGKPSIQFNDPDPPMTFGPGDDLEHKVDAASSHTVTARICNVSDDQPVTISGLVFSAMIVKGAGFFNPTNADAVSFTPTPFPTLPFSFPFEEGDSCKDVDVKMEMSAAWLSAGSAEEAKIRVTATNGVVTALMHITLIKN